MDAAAKRPAECDHEAVPTLREGASQVPERPVAAAEGMSPEGGSRSGRPPLHAGGETPETGTPLTRSLSPSSDGGASAGGGHSERAGKAKSQPVSDAAGAAACHSVKDDSSRNFNALNLEGGAMTAVYSDKAAAPDEEAATTEGSDAATAGAAVVPPSEEAAKIEGSSDFEQADATVAPTGTRRSNSRGSGAKGSRAKVQPQPQAARAAPEKSQQQAVSRDFSGGGEKKSSGGTGGGEQRAKTASAQVPTMGAFGIPGGNSMNHSVSDRRVVEVLAAAEQTHRRLLRTAKLVPELLLDPSEPSLANSAELYGSLALDMNEPGAKQNWKQDWASYYVNAQSDVDFVVDVRPGVSPIAVAQRLLKKGPWQTVAQVQVHKFASTQFTLLGRFSEDDDCSGEEKEVYLDLTCIEHPMQFKRFKKRQEAFRKVFLDVRSRIEAHYGPPGVLAFDAYIHLLKAFAAKVPSNALTGFQATCIGLFTLQIGHFRLKHTLSIALSFFEGFLRFCFQFYMDTQCHDPMGGTHLFGYRHLAIDLSSGRLLPRQSTSWRSELYFMGVEARELNTRPDEWMNVTHSLDPVRVSAEAFALLNRAFASSDGSCAPGGS
eukprot:TRINITY_DN28025_c0_g1_i1.p1 TRINITY_DN28025_c0_g1~~TRINITY_DN28025_c0_g1_i1.p1  ORF type:complete len:627 (+),score=122.23 TRINITY_DN28025_c0_g1_i1:75-1883(+)